MAMPPTILSKSLYMKGMQCPKYLWIVCHEKERIPPYDESTMHLFNQGKLIGDLARTLFPGGAEIKADYWDYAASNNRSVEALELRKPLFEAGFVASTEPDDNTSDYMNTAGIYSRADILMPVGTDEDNEWDIIEVKSGTSVKDENVQDVAFQKHCYITAGLKIRKCFLLHVNNEYVRKGKIDVKKLFVKEDITEKVSDAILGIEDRIAFMLKVISGRKCPGPDLGIKIGPMCDHPYECPLKDYCWEKMPLTSVFNLHRIGIKAFELYESGVMNIENIPSNYELNEKQLIQHKCAKSGKPCIHKEKIKEFLKTLKYPLYFMDFETYSTAIPLYNGLKPYQNIPFQFSVHVQEKENGELKHYSFIAEGSSDPRKKFIEELKKVLGTEGSIIVYFQSFEKGRLEELGKIFPKHRKWVKSVIKRIVDLFVPFKNFYYYDSRQHGSASLKEVLPTLTGKSYEGMGIAEGNMASLSYLYITHGSIDGKKATSDETKKIRHDLEEYCGLDTEGMVWIVKKLRELTT